MKTQPKIKEFLEWCNPEVVGSFDARSITSPLPGFNPTVGYYLDLLDVTTIPIDFNPTLRTVTARIPDFNPTV